MKNGRFIVFEGIDGSGKTTQVRLLCEKLKGEGREVHLSAEPTDYPSGKALREALGGKVKKSECEMAAMFLIDRIAHNITEDDGIEDRCARGEYVISDRYYYSTLAYQGQATDYAWAKSMNLNCPEIRRPDLCIYLDLTPEKSLERISKGRESVEIYENLDKLTKVRNAFLSVIDDLKRDGEKIFIVDADRSVEAIAEEISAIVDKELK